MNDGSPVSGAPATQRPRTIHQPAADGDLRRLRVTLVHVAEALEDGAVDCALELALGALESGEICDPLGRRRECPTCADGVLRWPGELEHHEFVAHTTAPAAIAAPPLWPVVDGEELPHAA